MIVLMVVTFLLPFTRTAWDTVDCAFFKTLNGTLKNHVSLQMFWALANHKLTDWVHDLIFLALITASVFSVPREERLKKISQFIFLGLYIACILFFINRLIFRKHFHFERLSPTLTFLDSIRLSREITSIKLKDASPQSFPGDHGTTALLFAAGYAFYANRKLATLGWIYGIFICLPRLITGAHWLSDVVIGSGSIALLFLGWAFYSPFGSKMSHLIERSLCLCLRKPHPSTIG